MPDLGGLPTRYEKALELLAIANGTSVIEEITEAIEAISDAELVNYGAINTSEYGYGSFNGRRIWMNVPPKLVDLAMRHDFSARSIMLRAVERYLQRMMIDDAAEFASKLTKALATQERLSGIPS